LAFIFIIYASQYPQSKHYFLPPPDVTIPDITVKSVTAIDGEVLGVMSDINGNLEAASTLLLGASGTNYTTPFPGSGPAPPFPNRGMEGGGDGYTVMGNSITVSMYVSEPGDWIRVVTRGESAPEPTTLFLIGTGLVGLVGFRRKFKT